jgi:peptide/nickel transport system permease protein
MKKFKKNKLASAALVVLGIIFLGAILAPALSPYDPGELGEQALQPPSAHHLLGTDDFGRDVFSRILYGARVSLTVGLVAVFISVVIGTMLGAISGYFGSYVDSIVMRFVDIMLSFPSIFLILIIQVMLTPNIYNVMIVIGATSWMGVARLVRAEFLSVKERPYVEAARALGASDFRLITKHILPNASAPIIVAATLGIAGAILTESALSFLGLGVQPPFASWGNMLQDSQAYLRDAPWMALVPGLMILITVLCIYFVGEGIREALDPRA